MNNERPYVLRMVMTTVLAECDVCKKEVEAKILECDDCFEVYMTTPGADESKYGNQHCDHIQCRECGTRLF